jgi:glycosyltransferase involved in cell wall biosynthesis
VTSIDAVPKSLPIELSVVLPTYQEAHNVPVVISRIAETMREVGWEVVFVDDNSPDQTSSVARAIARVDRRVRVVTRIGQRGLASACVQGILASSGIYIAVMDADLQHDERLLRSMLDVVHRGEADRVVGSRYLNSTKVLIIALHRNNGDGAFTKLVVDDAVDGAYGVWAVDFGRDGLMDVLSAGRDDGTIAVHRQVAAIDGLQYVAC